MKIICRIFCFLALFLASSCAFFANSKTASVSINSNPQGADILIDGVNYGKTPAVINLQPKSYTVILSKNGYGTGQVNLEYWYAIRPGADGKRCLADALGTMLILPAISYWSSYCRMFKQDEYFANLTFMGRGYGNNANYNRPINNPSAYNPQPLQQQPSQQQNYQNNQTGAAKQFDQQQVQRSGNIMPKEMMTPGPDMMKDMDMSEAEKKYYEEVISKLPQE